MIYSSRPNYNLDKHQHEHISYVIHQCVECRSPLSLRCASFYNNQYKYLFESNGLPNFELFNMLSIYFDSMSVDVNKECISVTLTMDFKQGISF